MMSNKSVHMEPRAARLFEINVGRRGPVTLVLWTRDMQLQAEQIAGLRTASVDYEKTELLKARIESLCASRDPTWLSADDLEPIFKWKLDGQYGRQRKIRSTNTDQAYRAVTQSAFLIVGPDPAYELTLRTNLLTALPGIGIGVASAILALAEPQSYCVIDFRGWRAAYGEHRSSFTVGQFRRYRNDVSLLANELGWSIQETDLAMWEYDRRRHGPAAEQ